MRPKLSIPAQIKDMKEAGITFDIFSENEAARYLDLQTYYFRVKSYAKNYEKYLTTDKQGQYINLDFAYLVDLSEIDSLLRELVLKMTLTLEHYLKVKLLSDFNASHEDGYDIIIELFNMQPELKTKIEEEKVNTSTSNELITKYKDNWAIWNIVEVISLGSLSELYNLFYSRNNIKHPYTVMLHPIRMIRNAAAHDNCLINRLRPPYSRNITPSYDLRVELMQEAGISKKAIDNKLFHPLIHDFSTLMYVFSRIVPESSHNRIYSEIDYLFNTRMILNKDYYSKNNVIKSSYEILSQVISYYIKTEEVEETEIQDEEAEI